MTNKIINGEEADPHEFPFQALVLTDLEPATLTVSPATGNCGGSIISPRHILSAAHCMRDPRYCAPMFTSSLTIFGEDAYY